MPVFGEEIVEDVDECLAVGIDESSGDGVVGGVEGRRGVFPTMRESVETLKSSASSLWRRQNSPMLPFS